MSDLALKVACRYLYGGLFEPPPAMVDAAVDQAKKFYIGHMIAEAHSYRYLEPEFAKKRVAYLKRKVPGAVVEENTSKKYKMPIDLEGWKYRDVIEKHKDKQRMPFYLLKLTKGKYYSKSEASWNRRTHIMSLKYPARPTGTERDTAWLGKEIAGYFRDLQFSIRHEMIHLAQSLFSYVFGHERPGGFEEPPPPGPGLPSKKIMTPEFQQAFSDWEYLSPQDQQYYQSLWEKVKPLNLHPLVMHTLEDLEFYADLSSFIGGLKYDFRNIKDREKRKQRFKKLLKTTDFFSEIKRAAPGKWRKYMKEIYKELI